VREARGHVGQITGSLRHVETEVGVGKDALFYAPIFNAVLARDQKLRRKTAVFFRHKTPGSLAFNHMRVGIDHSHDESPPRKFVDSFSSSRVRKACQLTFDEK
jgi:hypothetical protein